VNLDAVLDGLGLPTGARVDRRVPKRMLAEKSPRRLRTSIERGIEQLRWVAVLKPGNCSIAAGTFQPSDGDPVPVAEISVLTLGLRDGARVLETSETIHRTVPYHVLLLAEQGGMLQVSVAWKRRSLAQAEHFVLIDRPLVSPAFETENPVRVKQAFLAHLALSRRPAGDLAHLYQGWADAILAAQAALISGHFRPTADADAARRRQEALAEHQRLSAEIATLASRIKRATQVRDRVELSTQLKQAELDLGHIRSLL